VSRRGYLGLFAGFGVELEYMLVSRHGLAVMPAVDRLLAAEAGEIVSEVEVGDLSWSNELVLHVIELKTNGPTGALEPLPSLFQDHVRRLNRLAAALDARLMPTAMHPLMDPAVETRLWPHEYSPVYEAFDRIFGCRGHGWSNLQSSHLNLPFADDEEFGRLHAAIRLVLPILPALAASSPVVEGRVTGLLDSRLEAYRANARRIPSVTGAVIPEAVFTRRAYEDEVFAPMYRDIAPFDPGGVLQHEFLNARGAIARFDRQSIEIRLLDVQECPLADLAIVAAVVAVLRLLVGEDLAPLDAQQAMPVNELVRILDAVIIDADEARIESSLYLRLLAAGAGAMTAGDLWDHLLELCRTRKLLVDEPWRAPLELIRRRGPLARRIVHSLGAGPSRSEILQVYGRLCDCLATGSLFE